MSGRWLQLKRIKKALGLYFPAFKIKRMKCDVSFPQIPCASALTGIQEASYLLIVDISRVQIKYLFPSNLTGTKNNPQNCTSILHYDPGVQIRGKQLPVWTEFGYRAKGDAQPAEECRCFLRREISLKQNQTRAWSEIVIMWMLALLEYRGDGAICVIIKI